MGAAGNSHPKVLHRDLKLYCVTHETSVMAFVTKAIQEKLAASAGSSGVSPSRMVRRTDERRVDSETRSLANFAKLRAASTVFPAGNRGRRSTGPGIARPRGMTSAFLLSRRGRRRWATTRTWRRSSFPTPRPRPSPHRDPHSTSSSSGSRPADTSSCPCTWSRRRRRRRSCRCPGYRSRRSRSRTSSRTSSAPHTA